MAQAVPPLQVEMEYTDRGGGKRMSYVYGHELANLRTLKSEMIPEEYPNLFHYRTEAESVEQESFLSQTPWFHHPESFRGQEAVEVFRSARNPCGYRAPWYIPLDEHEQWMDLLNGDVPRMLLMVAGGVRPRDYIAIKEVHSRVSKMVHFHEIILHVHQVNRALRENLLQDGTESFRPYEGADRDGLIYRAASVRWYVAHGDGDSGHMFSVLIAAYLSELLEIATGQDRFSEDVRLLFWMCTDPIVGGFGLNNRSGIGVGYGVFSNRGYATKLDLLNHIKKAMSGQGINFSDALFATGHHGEKNPYIQEDFSLSVVNRAIKLKQHCDDHGLSQQSMMSLMESFASTQDIIQETSNKGRYDDKLDIWKMQDSRRKHDVTPNILHLLTTDEAVDQFAMMMARIDGKPRTMWSVPLEGAVKQLLGGVPIDWVEATCTAPHEYDE